MEDYPLWSDPLKTRLAIPQQSSPAREVEWLEYWSAPLIRNNELVEQGWYIVEVDGEKVLEKENPYLIVPYIYEFSGLGRKHADGDPHHMGVGLLRRKRGEMQAEVILKTILLAEAQMHAFPTVLTTDDAQQVAKQFAVGPGRVIKHAPQQEPKYLERPVPNANLYTFLSQVKADISTVANPALQGQRSADYGILQAQLTGQALTHLRPIREALDEIGTHTLNMMASLARVMDLDMSGVQSKDFTHENFSVSFDVVTPEENERLLMSGQTLRRLNDISRRTYWEKFAKSIVEDPEEENLRLMEEQLLAQAISSGAMLQVVMQEGNLQQGIEKQQEVQQDIRKQVRKQGLTDLEQRALQNRASTTESMMGMPGQLSQAMQTATEGAQSATKQEG